MKKIIFIPAKNSLKNSGKLKVAAYCRVSTKRETQKRDKHIKTRELTEIFLVSCTMNIIQKKVCLF